MERSSRATQLFLLLVVGMATADAAEVKTTTKSTPTSTKLPVGQVTKPPPTATPATKLIEPVMVKTHAEINDTLHGSNDTASPTKPPMIRRKENPGGFAWSRSQTFYASHGSKLVGFKVGERGEVKTVTQCAMICYRTDGCESINFNKASSLCELNSVSDLDKPDSMTPKEGWGYYRKNTYTIDESVLGPCSKRPCHNGGKCIKRSGENSPKFMCVCAKGWIGDTCEEEAEHVDWGPWEDWSKCSTTCGQGWQTRDRKCLNEFGKQLSTDECYGANQEQRACAGLKPCPAWDTWEEWSECSTLNTCGPGTMVRNRKCSNGGKPGIDRLCMGVTNQSKPCDQPSCSAPLKLVGGSSTGEGRLLVYNSIEKTWGAVCNEGWNKVSADVACRQLGYVGAAANYDPSDSSRGSSQKPIFLKSVQCSGDEGTLYSCLHSGWSKQMTCPKAEVTLKCIVNGDWNAWSEWGDCSVTCAHGESKRTRTCDYPLALRGGKECVGENMQSRPCTMIPCPVDGDWKDWSDWQECNVTCGGGWQLRTRECSEVLHGGQDCNGPSDDRQQCNTHECPIDCVWDAWSTWNKCSVTCGGGEQRRTRTQTGPFYGGSACVGKFDDWQDCNVHECPVDCQWEDWSDWQTCNTTCGGGMQLRTREKTGPFYGGAACVGSNEDRQECNTHECPIDCVWDVWSSWQACNRTCDGGWQKRTRVMKGPFYGGSECIGDTNDYQQCNTHNCPADCYWNNWEDWQACNTSCGGGMQMRTRTKVGPKFQGKECEGDPFDWQGCNDNPCPIDGYWLEWSAWGSCSVTCANGTHDRNRTCVPPKYEGADCVGDEKQTQECFERHCPVDGVWGTWSAWATCSSTCGLGVTSRNRTCSEPLYGGAPCDGDDREEQECEEGKCAVDGVLSDWSVWSVCSVTCENGTRSRSRQCTPPQNGGADCAGDLEEEELCEEDVCPVDGVWEPWSAWTDCSVSCGAGDQGRTRVCVPPVGTGRPCEGEDAETQACDAGPCPVDGVWSEWASWGECSVTCAGGQQGRERQCMGRAHGGKDCEGDGQESQTCNEKPCPVDGVWSVWSDWRECEPAEGAECGPGLERRERECVGPFHNGLDCPGDSEDTKPCEIDCAKPGEWLSWSAWSLCSATCGPDGLRERTRDCNMTTHGADLTAPCEGDETEAKACHNYDCLPVAPTCAAWAERGLEDSVRMPIDPSGAKVLWARCNLTEDRPLTEIEHNHMGRTHVKGYEEAGTFKMDIEYNVKQEDLEQLAAVTEGCRQFIMWECIAAAINNPHNPDIMMTWWKNRDGTDMRYWGGADPNGENCACGDTNSCLKDGTKCNCDINNDELNVDSGYITNWIDLPVKGFLAGDTGTKATDPQGVDEEGWVTIGPLQCYGELLK